LSTATFVQVPSKREQGIRATQIQLDNFFEQSVTDSGVDDVNMNVSGSDMYNPARTNHAFQIDTL
jgi:hypothetical protein